MNGDTVYGCPGCAGSGRMGCPEHTGIFPTPSATPVHVPQSPEHWRVGLIEAVGVIRAWHGTSTGTTAKATWRNYWAHAPEMAPLRALFDGKDPTGPA